MSAIINKTISMITASLGDKVKNDYGNEIHKIYNDAKVVKSNMQEDLQSFETKVRTMKNKPVFKRISDWFNTNADEFQSEDEEDFDAGFKDGNKEDETVIDSLDNATKKQLNAMFRIGGKQVESSMANTSEIVTVINSRTSEVVAAINDISRSINGLGSKLDDLISLNTISVNKEQFTRSDSITDSDGKIGLPQLYEKMKQTNEISNNLYVTSLEMLRTAATAGGPRGLIDQSLNMLTQKIKIGDKTIDDIGKGFNETSGAIIQSTLSELINKDFIKKIIGNVNTMNADTDYSKLTPNQYNTSAAKFDGMTRKTIVDVIPSYLKTITEHLTGVNYNIDNRGKLTTANVEGHEFKDKVLSNAFSTSGLSENGLKNISGSLNSFGEDISDEDINNASRALMMVYVLYLHKHGITTLAPSQIDPTNLTVINQAVDALLYSTNKSRSYWERVCSTILISIRGNVVEAARFSASVNKQVTQMVEKGIKLSQDMKYGDQSKRITYSDTREAFKEYVNRDDTSSIQEQATPVKQTVTRVDTPVVSTNYQKSIFDILNRGINVKVIKGKPYESFSIGSGFPPSDKEPEVTEKDMDVNISNNGKDFSYLSSMVDGLVPKQIRLGMQYFASNHNGTPIDPNNQTESPQSVLASISSMLKGTRDSMKSKIENSDKLNSISKSIFGNTSTDDQGNKVRTGGIINNTKDFVSNKFTAVRDTTRDKISERVDKSNYNKLVKDVERVNPANSNEDLDKTQAQHIFALMQSALADGDTSSDTDSIQNEINQINNPTLRARLSASILPMLKRSAKAKSEQPEKEKSGFGKIIALASAGFVKVLSPVKKILSSIFLGIKTFAKKALSLMTKMLYSGAVDVGVGAKAIGSGIVGLTKTLAVDSMKAVAKTTTSILKNVGSVTKSFYKTLGNLASTVGTKLTSGIKTLTSKLSTSFKSIFSTVSSKIKVPDALSNLGNKFAESSFGKNFLGVFNEAKEKKEAAKLSKANTMSDVKSDSMEQMLSGRKDSVLKTLVGIATDIKNTITQNNGTDNSTAETDNSTAETVISAISATSGNQDADIAVPEITDAEGDATASDQPAAGGIKGKLGKIGSAVSGSLGKIAGGILSVLGGLAKMVLSIVMSMSGFKAIMDLIKGVLTSSLEPLNKTFNSILKVIKPIMKSVQSILTTVVETVVEIAEAIIDTIQPIIEAIQPLLDTIMTLLQPILELITGLVKVIMAPLAGVIQHVVVPILRQVGNTLEVIMGAVQIGMGTIISAFGAVLTGIGVIISKFIGKDDMKDKGKEMLDMGSSMVSSGLSSVKSGITKTITDFTSIFSTEKEQLKEEETKSITTVKPTPITTGGSVMDGVMSNSSTTVGTTDTTIVGSGDAQGSYGSYMNMSSRGCGPVALAEMYSRKTGKNVAASDLASHMAKNGWYNPNKGTSVADYINTSRALGINVSAGSVTNDSIKRASVNNPITVIGNGYEYGTRKGNNHYMNIVGSDRYGNAYVSNPLTGKVSKQPVGAVVSRASLGIYGSGDADIDESGYKFPDAVSEALKRLSSITSNIFSIFTGESTDEETQNIIDSEKNMEEVKQAKGVLGEEGYSKYRDKAFELFKRDNPQRNGESELQYTNRFEEVLDHYIMKASREDILELEKNSTSTSYDSLLKLSQSMYGNYDSESGEFAGNGFTKQYGDTADATSASITGSSVGSYSGAGGVFVSDGGAALGINYDPEIKETAMTQLVNGKHAHSPIHEFFRRMAGEPESWSEEGNYWKLRNRTNDEGAGQAGSSHTGVDIHTTNDDVKTVPLYATTDGVVTGAYGGITRKSGGYADNGGAGNYVTWKDVAGNVHRYLHMGNSQMVVNPGDTVEGGKTLLGYIGNTGDSYGYHLHYDIGGGLNPMTYFKYVPPTNSLSGGSDDERIWNYLRAKGLSASGTAGLMGNLKAESNLESDNLQNSYEYLGNDQTYTSNVDNGSYSRDNFANDSAGYGLAQWTYYTRKRALYDYIKQNPNTSIGDLRGQLDFLNKELTESYQEANQAARSEGNLADITRRICEEYENPAFNNSSERISLAQQFYDKYASKPIQATAPSLYPTATVNPVNSPSDAKLYEESRDISTGTLVSITPGATYYTGDSIPDKVMSSNMYVKSVSGDRVILGATEDGVYSDINSPINLKYITRVGEHVTIDDSSDSEPIVDLSSLANAKASPQTTIKSREENPDMSNWYRNYGSGDESVDIGDLRLNDYSYNDPIIMNDQSNDNRNNSGITVNKFEIKRDKSAELEKLNKILNNTYNVRSENIEALLNKIIEKMESNNQTASQKINSSNTNQGKLFDDNIPSEVIRLNS